MTASLARSEALRRVVPALWRPIGYLDHLARRRTAGLVHAGPFVGMRYAERPVGSCFIPKLLGTYERELAPRRQALGRSVSGAR